MYLSELSFVLTFIFTFKRYVYIKKFLYSRNMRNTPEEERNFTCIFT